VWVELPNTGKSQILASLTNAPPLITAYPFTPRTPLPGMMNFENAQIQIVDAPPRMDEFAEPGRFNLIPVPMPWPSFWICPKIVDPR
jgi:ribosome-interacting GTPase 1